MFFALIYHQKKRKMNKLSWHTEVLILLIFLLSSCHQNSEKAESLSSSSSTDLLDSLFNDAVSNKDIPGAVAYIIRDGNVVYEKSFGWRNIEKEIPMEANDIFRMASMTKGLTAVSVLQLCQRGLISLDDNLSKYIPEFSNPQVLEKILPDSTWVGRPAKSEITIRQLLTHTSGIGYGFLDEKYNSLIIKNKVSEGFEDDNRTSQENIQKLAKIPLMCDPGERYIYSMSYDVLGVVIEKVSGMRYDKYVAKNILQPLQMNESYFIVPEEEQFRLVSIYQPSSGRKWLEPTTYPDTAYPVIASRQYFSAGGDLCSTAQDYARFVQMILNKGTLDNVRVLGERYVEMMLSRQTSLEDGDSYQGFAAWVVTSKGAAKGPMPEGAYGFGGFWDTYSWADPGKNFVAVLLLQMYPGDQINIHQKFQSIVYGVIDDL
jgi:CubicO group peptidase (beta-lactamase class C family)